MAPTDGEVDEHVMRKSKRQLLNLEAEVIGGKYNTTCIWMGRGQRYASYRY